MSRRVCPVPGCGTLTDGGRCQTHAREQDKARGTSTERGYTYRHRQERLRWKAKVQAGIAACARCGKPLKADEPFDLDHTDDRTGYIGVSCVACNRRAPRLI